MYNYISLSLLLQLQQQLLFYYYFCFPADCEIVSKSDAAGCTVNFTEAEERVEKGEGGGVES